jgi:hypothetical protein
MSLSSPDAEGRPQAKLCRAVRGRQVDVTHQISAIAVLGPRAAQ